MERKEVSNEDRNFIKWFSELSRKDIRTAGLKGANLADMYNNNFPVPAGFVVTTEVFDYFLEKNVLKDSIKNILENLDINNLKEVKEKCGKVRDLIKEAEIPEELKEEILDAYDVLDADKKNFGIASTSALDILRTSHEPPFVAVRSSVVNEKFNEMSFAGSHDNFLNVKGDYDLIEKIKEVFISFFSERAVIYRRERNYDNTGLGIVVQKMVDADKSGIVFSKNPVRNDGNILIESVWGLGIGVVSGRILPDHHIISPEYELVDKVISEKNIAFARNSSGEIDNIILSPEKSKHEVLNNYEIKRLAQFASQIEEFFGTPQDIEFAIDKEGIHIVQARPITTEIKVSEGEIEGNVIVKGKGVSGGFVSGIAKVVRNFEDLNKIQKGDIVVAKMIEPKMFSFIKDVSAIVTDEGGINSQIAIIAREKGIPIVSGTKIGTQKIKELDKVSVDGFTGNVIEGYSKEKKIEIMPAIPTRMRMKLVLDRSDFAKKATESGIKEVGVVRVERLIESSGRHAVWYLKNDKIDEYVTLLYNGIKKIAENFDKIWIRTSSIRSDRHKNLEGAPKTESNPMMGDYGIRFSLKNQDLLEGEFKAIKELADEFHEKIFGIMLARIVSVNELKEAKKILRNVGVPENVKIGIMIETPAAVHIIDSLCEEGIDFVNFGVEDLAQYILAVDKENENIRHLHNETDPAVLNSIKYTIRRCKSYGVETCVFGDLKNKDMIRFLVKEKVDSVSIEPDSIREVSESVSEFEKESVKDKIEKTKETTEEDLILKALEKTDDEPEPDEPEEPIPVIESDKEVFSLEEIEDLFGSKEEDIPNLNEAISVDSENFDNKKNEVIEVKDESEAPHTEFFETQADEEIDKEIEKEAAEFEAFKEAQEKNKKNENDDEEQVLDIF